MAWRRGIGLSSEPTRILTKLSQCRQRRMTDTGYVGWAFYVDDSGVIRGSAFGKDSGSVIPGKDAPPVRSQ